MEKYKISKYKILFYIIFLVFKLFIQYSYNILKIFKEIYDIESNIIFGEKNRLCLDYFTFDLDTI